MNKYQRAFGIIDTILQLMRGIERKDGYRPTQDEMKESMIILKELVEKATPKRAQMSEDISKCPSCNSFVTSIDIYCPNCGQRLNQSKERKKIELSEEEKNILKIYITPFKDQIIAITRCTDYLREYLYIMYNDGSNKYVWL